MDANSNRSIGRALRCVREERGLTQVELAASLGKPQSFISKIESGERSLHVYELFSYAEALGMDAQELVGRLEEVREETQR